MSKIGPSIPAIEGVKDPSTVKILSAMKTRIEMMGGETPNRKLVQKLGAAATTGGIIAKINEIIDRLQV